MRPATNTGKIVEIKMNAPSLLYQLPVYEDTVATSFRLSVVVPVYNERHVVEASLRRVLALEHEIIRDLEVIVVDDCSTDGTREILQRIASQEERVTLLLHDLNQGKGAAIRTAVEGATGDIIIIHDADLESHHTDTHSCLC